MANKQVQLQRFARYYREKVNRDATSQEIAEAARAEGWKMPVPKTPVELLAKEFSVAMREEMKYDPILGESYNANICYPVQDGQKQLMFWADTDTASRNKFEKNKVLRRDQVVGRPCSNRNQS